MGPLVALNYETASNVNEKKTRYIEEEEYTDWQDFYGISAAHTDNLQILDDVSANGFTVNNGFVDNSLHQGTLIS